MKINLNLFSSGRFIITKIILACSFFIVHQTYAQLNPGDKAPELKLNNAEGKPIALSSLKGKIVLIDFWAAWCRPCRMNNPNLVILFKKYKDAKFKTAKGFTIYSVSLDGLPNQNNAKQSWLNAIKQDGLIWENHVSELKGWSSETGRLYGVNSIPSTILIDEKGVIIGRNIRPVEIDKELTKRLKENAPTINNQKK